MFRSAILPAAHYYAFVIHVSIFNAYVEKSEVYAEARLVYVRLHLEESHAATRRGISRAGELITEEPKTPPRVRASRRLHADARCRRRNNRCANAAR